MRSSHFDSNQPISPEKSAYRHEGQNTVRRDRVPGDTLKYPQFSPTRHHTTRAPQTTTISPPILTKIVVS